jgi:hypothetical protein
MVACPACGRSAKFSPGNPWRPFCGERCRTLDLGAWASERYRVDAGPAVEPGADDSDPESR